MPLLRRFCTNQSGATVIEYGLIAAVLSLAIVAGVGTAANSLKAMWADNDSRLNQALK